MARRFLGLSISYDCLWALSGPARPGLGARRGGGALCGSAECACVSMATTLDGQLLCAAMRRQEEGVPIPPGEMRFPWKQDRLWRGRPQHGCVCVRVCA